MNLAERSRRLGDKRSRGEPIRVLLLRTSSPGVAGWPADRPFKLPACQVIAPLGILYLASVLRREMAGEVEVMVHSLSTAVRSMDGLAAWLATQRPDILGISSLNVEREMAVEVARAARALDDGTVVIAGGPYATYLPRECLEWTDADLLVRGEAEAVIAPLVRALVEGRDPGGIPGTGLPARDGVRLAPAPDPIDPLDALDLPAWDAIDIGAYSTMYNMLGLPVSKPPYVPLLTSRGCPYQCSFCHNYFGRRFRPRSPESVLSEIELLHDRYGVGEFHIVDDVFNFDGDRVEAICRSIIDRGLDIAMAFPNGVRGDILTRSQIELLAHAGCVSMCLSLESASPRIQKLMRKRLDMRRLGETARIASDLGIITKIIFMVGYPGETREEMEATLAWVRDSACDLPQHSIACPLPGTEMHRQAQEWNPGFDYSTRSTEDYNAFKPLTAMDEKEFREVHPRGVAEPLSEPRRVGRLQEIRHRWPPDTERYFDWTLDGVVPGMPVRGGVSDAVPREEMDAILAGLGSGSLGPGWKVAALWPDILEFDPPSGPRARVRIARRDDTKPRMGFSARYNLTYVPSDGMVQVDVSDALGRILAAFRSLDPCEG